jgi:glutamine amidotransferase
MAKETIAIIDYGSGNLRSAAKAFEHVVTEHGLGHKVVVTNRAKDIAKAGRIVLPGQGAFGDCMDNLKATDGMIDALEDAVIKNGKPFLGICVGMQLLATRGLEHGSHAGLNWIPGQVTPLTPSDKTLKIPHMGWNELITVSYEGSTEEQNNTHFVLRSTESADGQPQHYYFVHSYMFECEYNHHILSMAEYGGPVTAIVGRDNIIGVQFHPEKSAEAGLDLIKSFIEWRP